MINLFVVFFALGWAWFNYSQNKYILAMAWCLLCGGNLTIVLLQLGNVI